MATARHAAGTSSRSRNRAFRPGWSKSGKATRALIRHEQGIEEVLLPVERAVARRELDIHDVVAGRHGLGRDDDVLVAHLEVDRLAGDPDRMDALRRLREVEDHRADLGERERGGHAAGDRLGALVGNREPDVIEHVEDRGGAPLGQLQRHAGIHFQGTLAAAPGRHAGQDGTSRRHSPHSRAVHSHV